MNNSWVKIIIEAVLLIALVLGAYYKLDGRVTMVEHQAGQELLGYKNLVSSLGERLRDIDTRLARIEGKLE